MSCSRSAETESDSVSALSFKKSKDSILIIQYNKADSLFQKKNYSTSLKIALDVLEQAKKKNDAELTSNTNYLIGKVWYESRSYEKAITYFKSSLDGFSKILSRKKDYDNKKISDFEDYLILENNYNVGRSYHKLYEIWRRNGGIKELTYKDSTLFYYDKIIKSNSFKNEISLLKSKAFNNLSGLYIRDSLFSLAEKYALKSLEIKKKIGDQYLIASGYNALSNIHFYRKEYKKSKVALFKGLKALEKIKGEKSDVIRADLYLNIAFSMYKLKDYKAYEYQEFSWNISDDIKEKYNERKLAEIYANKNFEIGMKEGILQEEIKLLEQKDKTWFVTVLSISILIVLIGTIAYFKFRQKNLSLKISRNELIQQQKIEKLKSESQIRILNATIDGKESERKQIAETLHDSVSTLLSSANLHLQACRSQFNGSTPVEVEKSQKIITEASDKIRDLSHTLVSSVLLKFGLQYSLKDMADKYSNSQIEISTEISDLRRYDQSFEIKAYNIIQEFINNILKHSKATKASLVLYEKDGRLMLVISDNGQGFNKELIPEKDGLGINQIDARIKMMKGEFNIETSKGKGTKITVELPIQEREIATYV
jgi:signal transduction histidine kinase/tetratricopeptide (TPR) repeat protein